jgi:uncharacterized protein (TIGR00369 family)
MASRMVNKNAIVSLMMVHHDEIDFGSGTLVFTVAKSINVERRVSESTTSDGILEFQEKLLRAPFHRWLNLKAVSTSKDELRILLPWREEFVSNAAIQATHGGILAALIDLTGLYAVRAAGGLVSATADLRVDYHRPATRGDIQACGVTVKLGKRISVADVRVIDSDKRLLASGRGAYLAQ